ncbi:hypothetical protein Q8A67_004651 [Cirrhinus molitorella]|uniref:Uncharacterized protein n=1 Tax=Cirrhinus molitorella TaxID=172907 RepID=A0AA88Q173_9TELE|nr:hypothetical protein Q8A67_004651 [Cirrhinus molitorella]
MVTFLDDTVTPSSVDRESYRNRLDKGDRALTEKHRTLPGAWVGRDRFIFLSGNPERRRGETGDPNWTLDRIPGGTNCPCAHRSLISLRLSRKSEV